ncbi:hypothetical protein Salat_1439900, partial [Sesamum alatum]
GFVDPRDDPLYGPWLKAPLPSRNKPQPTAAGPPKLHDIIYAPAPVIEKGPRNLWGLLDTGGWMLWQVYAATRGRGPGGRFRISPQDSGKGKQPVNPAHEEHAERTLEVVDVLPGKEGDCKGVIRDSTISQEEGQAEYGGQNSRFDYTSGAGILYVAEHWSPFRFGLPVVAS